MEMRKGHDVGVVAVLRQQMTSLSGTQQIESYRNISCAEDRFFLLTGRAVCSDTGFLFCILFLKANFIS